MRRDWAVSLLLAAAVLVVYGPTVRYDFVAYDDPEYILEKPNVQAGLTWDGIGWAFTTTTQANWHPLTWLSHMADCQLFGLWAGGHHLTSVLLHGANSILLYVVLKRLTAAPWRSAMVAALFALHPLHVESVAWVAERKDVLSTLFWILTMGAYAGYAVRPGFWRYLPVVVFLALGLMSKPMLVTVPFVLLLLDYWPLGRLRWGENVGRRVLEKAPLFVLAAASCAVTYLAQKPAMFYAEYVPLSLRVENALVSCAAYLGKMLWPGGLAVFYPYPQAVPIENVAAAAASLAALTLGVIWVGRNRRYMPVGWFWFLGTLVPVIGLVQVGAQSMADRYTYVPLVGLFIAVVWGAADVAAVRRWGRIGLAVVAAAVVAACLILSMRQVRFWSDSKTLFRHALKVTTDNSLAHYDLGVALNNEGRVAEAVAHWRETLQIMPRHPPALTNVGVALFREGRVDEAIQHFQRAIEILPTFTEAHYNLGVALAAKNRFADAEVRYRAALRLDPAHHDARANLGMVLAAQGKFEEAEPCCRDTIRQDPRKPQPHNNLGVMLLAQGRLREAEAELAEAIRLAPQYANSHINMGLAMIRQGRLDESEAHYAEALRLDPRSAEARAGLGDVAGRRGRTGEAVARYQEALRVGPDCSMAAGHLAWIRATHPDPQYRSAAEAVALAERACALTARRDPAMLDILAAAYAEAGRFPEAVATAEEALRKAALPAAKDLAPQIEKRLQQYKLQQPYREIPSPGTGGTP